MQWSVLLLAACAPVLSLAADERSGRQDPEDLIVSLKAVPFRQPCGSVYIPKKGSRDKRQDPLEYFIPAISSLCEDAILHDDSKSKRVRRFVKEVIPFLADNYQGAIPSFSALPVPGAGNPTVALSQQSPSSQVFTTNNNQARPNGQINPNQNRPQFNQGPTNPRPIQRQPPNTAAQPGFAIIQPQMTFRVPNNQFQSFPFQNQGSNNRNLGLSNQRRGFNGFQ